MNDFIAMDNVIEMSIPKELAIMRDEEAYKEFRALLDANENLYRQRQTYYMLMRYANDITKDCYNDIKNELMSYVDKFDESLHVRYELTENGETFYLNNIIAQFRISGGVLLFYLKLDPKNYNTSDAIHKDVSDDARFVDTPLMLKANKQTRVRKAVSLIHDLMRENGCVKDEESISIDYASFFTRDTLFVSRKVKEENTEDVIEQIVHVTEQEELQPDDIVRLQAGFGVVSHISTDNSDTAEKAAEDEENATHSTDDATFVEAKDETIPFTEESDVSDSTNETTDIVEYGPRELVDISETETSLVEGNTVGESVVDVSEDGDGDTDVIVHEESAENLSGKETEESADANAEEASAEPEDPVYIYRNVANPQQRPIFREISDIRRKPIEPQANFENEKKSIFKEQAVQKETTTKKKKPNIWRELSDYGYNFVLLRQLEFYALAIGVAVGLGLVYKLKWPFILVLVCTVLIGLPGVLSAFYRNKYEEKRFRDAESYIEQMLYSFRRNSKILMSLNDALVVFPNGYMHDRIVEAIDSIRNSKGSGNIYESALKIIEEAYPCRRIKSLHRYMIKVEGIGGKHEAGVNALLKDRRQWIDRTAAFRSQCSALIKEILISGIFSLIMAGIIVYMMPNDLFDLATSIVYQIATTIFVIVNLLVIRTTLKSTVVYLQDEDQVQAQKTVKTINWIRNYNPKAELRKSLKQSVIFLAVIVLGLIMGNLLISLMGLALGLFTIVIKRQLDLRSAKKRVRREIEKVYPDWLLELALLLQTDNLHVAIEKTLDSAPLVLQYDLRKLADDIIVHPVDLAPYVAFFDFLPMENVQSSMKLLYSISTFGAVDESVQISELVERNHTLMERAEKYRNDDKLSRVFSIKFIPMLSSSVKMLVDLMLFLFSYLSLIGTMM